MPFQRHQLSLQDGQFQYYRNGITNPVLNQKRDSGQHAIYHVLQVQMLYSKHTNNSEVLTSHYIEIQKFHNFSLTCACVVRFYRLQI